MFDFFEETIELLLLLLYETDRVSRVKRGSIVRRNQTERASDEFTRERLVLVILDSSSQSSSIEHSPGLSFNLQWNVSNSHSTFSIHYPNWSRRWTFVNVTFVRCIKPNELREKSASLTIPSVTRQLRYSGVLQMCEIRKKGYPLRIQFEEFLHR